MRRISAIACRGLAIVAIVLVACHSSNLQQDRSASSADTSALSLAVLTLQSPGASQPAVPVSSVEAGSQFVLSLNYTIQIGSSGELDDADIFIDLPAGIGVTGEPSFGTDGWSGSCTQNDPTIYPGGNTHSIWKWACEFQNASISSSVSVVSGQIQIPVKVRALVDTGRNGSSFTFSSSDPSAAARFSATGATTAHAAPVTLGVTASVAPSIYFATQLAGSVAPAIWALNPVTGEVGAEFGLRLQVSGSGSAQFAAGSQFVLTVPPDAWLVSVELFGPGYESVTSSLDNSDPNAGPVMSIADTGSITPWASPQTLNGLFTVTYNLPFDRYVDETGDVAYDDIDEFDDASYFLYLWVPCSALPDFQSHANNDANHTLTETFTGSQPEADGATTLPSMPYPTTVVTAVADVSGDDPLGQTCSGGQGTVSKTTGATYAGSPANWALNIEQPSPPIEEVVDVVVSDYVQQDGQQFLYQGNAQTHGSFELYYCNLPAEVPSAANGQSDIVTTDQFLAQLAAQGQTAPASLLDTSQPSPDAWCSPNISDFLPAGSILGESTSWYPVPNVTHIIFYAAHWGDPDATPPALPESAQLAYSTLPPVDFQPCPDDLGVIHDDFWITSHGADDSGDIVETPFFPAPGQGTPAGASAQATVICGAIASLYDSVVEPSLVCPVTSPNQTTFHKGDSFWYWLTFAEYGRVPIYNPVLTVTLPPGIHYQSGTSYFDFNRNEFDPFNITAPVNDPFTSCHRPRTFSYEDCDLTSEEAPCDDPTVTLDASGDTLVWHPISGTDHLQGALWAEYIIPNVIADAEGRMTYWDNFDYYPSYYLRFEVATDPNYPFADGAANTSCAVMTEDGQSQQSGPQSSCASAYALVPGEMRGFVLPVAECILDGDVGHFTITGSNTGGTDLTTFSVTAPIPNETQLASCTLDTPAGTDITTLAGTTLTYEVGGSFSATCPEDLSTVQAVRVTVADFHVGDPDLKFELPVTVLEESGSIAEHVTLACDSLVSITSAQADQPLVIGANCCTPVCNGTQCSDGCGGICQEGCSAMAAPGPCQLAAACSDGDSGTCVYANQPSGTSCSDSNACNGLETCGAAGNCQPGTPPILDDGNPCTIDTCDPLTGVHHTLATTGTSCSDGNACNGAETCDQSGTCQRGTPPVLDDGNPCTLDSCDPASGVQHAPAALGTSCSDGNPCNGVEICDQSGTCLAGTPPPLDDNNPCTVDTCDPLTGVVHTPALLGTACSDGNVCNGLEICDGAGTCHAGTPPTLDDGNPCTIDTCDPVNGVLHLPASDGTACDDGDACTQHDACQAGSCVGGDAVICAALDACHVAGTCDSHSGACSNPVALDGVTCNDGNACTQRDTCESGLCVGGDPVACSNVPGACGGSGTCNPATGACASGALADGTTCQDSNRCIVNDSCAGGQCGGSRAVCDDLIAWWAGEGDGHDSVGIATMLLTSTSFAAGEIDRAFVFAGSGSGNAPLSFTGAFTIDFWVHTDAPSQPAGDSPLSLPAAASGNGNGIDGTSAEVQLDGAGAYRLVVGAGAAAATLAIGGAQNTGFVHVAFSFDGQTVRTYYQGQPVAAQNVPVALFSVRLGNSRDDAHPFTGMIDEVHVFSGALADAQIAAIFASGGHALCAPTTSCDDGDPCTYDSCDPALGCRHIPVPDGGSCDDGNACTQGDVCHAGACVGGPPVVCAAADSCHVAGSCNRATGTCSTPAAADGTTCDDGNACTRSDVCSAGVCVGGDPIACAAQDQCHLAGTCNPTNGACSNPLAPDGTTCNDNNVCTVSDTCHQGACAGTAKNCDDGNACTADSCDQQSGACVHQLDDTVKPVIQCPPSVQITAQQLTIPAATATDNCGPVTITQDPPAGTVIHAGTTTVTATATDEAGNTASCTTTLTLVDGGSTAGGGLNCSIGIGTSRGPAPWLLLAWIAGLVGVVRRRRR